MFRTGDLMVDVTNAVLAFLRSFLHGGSSIASVRRKRAGSGVDFRILKRLPFSNLELLAAHRTVPLLKQKPFPLASGSLPVSSPPPAAASTTATPSAKSFAGRTAIIHSFEKTLSTA